MNALTHYLYQKYMQYGVPPYCSIMIDLCSWKNSDWRKNLKLVVPGSEFFIEKSDKFAEVFSIYATLENLGKGVWTNQYVFNGFGKVLKDTLMLVDWTRVLLELQYEIRLIVEERLKYSFADKKDALMAKIIEHGVSKDELSRFHEGISSLVPFITGAIYVLLENKFEEQQKFILGWSKMKQDKVINLGDDYFERLNFIKIALEFANEQILIANLANAFIERLDYGYESYIKTGNINRFFEKIVDIKRFFNHMDSHLESIQSFESDPALKSKGIGWLAILNQSSVDLTKCIRNRLDKVFYIDDIDERVEACKEIFKDSYDFSTTKNSSLSNPLVVGTLLMSMNIANCMTMINHTGDQYPHHLEFNTEFTNNEGMAKRAIDYCLMILTKTVPAYEHYLAFTRENGVNSIFYDYVIDMGSYAKIDFYDQSHIAFYIKLGTALNQIYRPSLQLFSERNKRYAGMALTHSEIQDYYIREYGQGSRNLALENLSSALDNIRHNITLWVTKNW